MKKNEKAFPVVKPAVYNTFFEGMDLRDYFAIHATEEDISYYKEEDMDLVKARYNFADKMMKERER